MKKYLFFLILLIFLVLLICFVNPFSAETTTSNSFTVTWYDCNYDLTQSSCKVDVQNLASFNRDFSLFAIINSTNYDLDTYTTSMSIKEWKILPSEVPIYETVWINETCYTDPINRTGLYDCSHNTTVRNGTEIKNISQWKPTKSNMLKKSTKQKMYYGAVTIPKYNSKAKVDDYNNIETINGTKTFLVEWTTPIIESPWGWGSLGLIAFIDENSGNVYHPWWNSTFSNKKAITITTTGTSTPEYYQVLLNITYASEMQADFDDIRFTNKTNSTLSYWIESKVNSSYANVWVNLSDAITDPGSDYIWMYYGNAGVSDGGVGTDTFDFFDDFSGDLSKWTLVAGTTPTIVDGFLVYPTATTVFSTISTFGLGTSIHAKFHLINLELIDTAFGYSNANTVGIQDSGQGDLFMWYSNTDNNRAVTKDAVSLTYTQISAPLTTGTYLLEIKRISDSSTFFDDGIATVTPTIFIPTISLPVTLGQERAIADNKFDWILVHKYIANEPTPSYGTGQYYVTSLLYNSTNNYNNTIESDGTLSVNHTIYPSDYTNWTANSVSTGTTYWIFTTAVTPSGNTNFTISGKDLDNFTVSGLTALSRYIVKNTTIVGSFTTDGAGTAIFEINLVAGDYTVHVNTLPYPVNITIPLNNSRHYSNSINYTWNQSTDIDGDTITYDFWLSLQSDFSSTVNRTNFTNNWTGNIATTDGVTYYGKVRSHDGYEYSNWSNTTQFTENSLPSISDVYFLQPSSPTGTTNLTIFLNITTDPESDTITNHTLWYINNVLNISYNNSLFLNYSNFTLGDSIYVKAYLRDGYENTSLTTSNSVIIGSQNSAPVLSSITLNPNIRKYNKSVWINSSNVTDLESSYIRLLTYYKLTNESKVYLNNSSWYAPPTTINVTFNSPWNDSNSHYIYAQVEDSGNISGFYNLTSGEVSATFTGDTTAPAVSTSSLSSSSIYTGSHVTVNMTTSLSNGTVSNVSVHVSRPDATEADYVMTTTNTTLWSYVYTSTSNVGSYYVEYFSMTDDSGNRGTETSTLTFVASTAPAGSTGGGGGGSSTIIVVKEVNGTQELIFTNITSIEELRNLSILGECFTSGLMLSNKCSRASISIIDEPLNWWTLFGAYLGSMITLFIISIATDTKKKFPENILFFGTVTWVSVVLLSFMGLNLYILNYIFNSPLPGFMFLSFVMWGGIVTSVGDYYSTVYKR